MNYRVNTRSATQTSIKPLMFLNVWPDGAVTGALMRSCAKMDLTGLIATTHTKSHEVIGFISEIVSMAPGDITHGLQRIDTRVHVHSLAEAIKHVHETSFTPFEVMIFYKGNWYLGKPSLCDLQNKKYIPEFQRVANLYDTANPSIGDILSDELFTALAGQTTSGDKQLMNQSLGFAHGLDTENAKYMRDPQYTPAVKHLCNWWNTQSPAAYQNAGAFYVYQWSFHEKKFMSCVKGIDDLTAKQLADKGSYSIFILNANEIVAVVFLCVKAAMVVHDGIVQVFLANGDPGYEYDTVSNVNQTVRANEARKSIAGLVNFLTFGKDESRKFG